MECLRLRVKDVDFSYGQITVRDGKGEKDRLTMLPGKLRQPLMRHLQKVKAVHEEDLRVGYGEVFLPYALARKYPGAPRQWGWQYLFPAPKRSIDPRSNRQGRHHLSESTIQKAVRDAIRKSRIAKTGSEFRIKRDPAKLLGSAVARSTQT